MSVARALFYLLFGGLMLLLYQHFSRTPCDQPIVYSIGQVDPGFGLSHGDVARQARDAVAMWNQAAGKPVFVEGLGGQVSLQFIYDERQQRTQEKLRLAGQIEGRRLDLDNVKQSFQWRQRNYQRQRAEFERLKQDYELALQRYNTDVAYWNARGGADAAAVHQLENEKYLLGQQQREINALLYELRQMERQLDQEVSLHNEIADDMNNTLNKLQQGVGDRFEGGEYDYQTRTITIYQYQTEDDLQRVLVHEFGHALMLQHVDDEAAIMYYLNNEQPLSLGAADVAELRRVCRLD